MANTHRNNIMKFSDRDLASFILQVAPNIGLQYTNSEIGISMWLNEEAPEGLTLDNYMQSYGCARR